MCVDTECPRYGMIFLLAIPFLFNDDDLNEANRRGSSVTVFLPRKEIRLAFDSESCPRNLSLFQSAATTATRDETKRINER